MKIARARIFFEFALKVLTHHRKTLWSVKNGTLTNHSKSRGSVWICPQRPQTALKFALKLALNALKVYHIVNYIIIESLSDDGVYAVPLLMCLSRVWWVMVSDRLIIWTHNVMIFDTRIVHWECVLKPSLYPLWETPISHIFALLEHIWFSMIWDLMNSDFEKMWNSQTFLVMSFLRF